MDRIVWFIITIPLSLLFTGLGIFAYRRKKPMWFWSGSEVSEYEITDVKAYNRANGIMWLVFSGVFWVSMVLGGFQLKIAGAVLTAGILAGIPFLVITYHHIYKKYRDD